MTLAANPRSLVFYMAYPGPGNLYDQQSDRLQERAMVALTMSLRTLAAEARKRKIRLALSVCDGGSPEPGLYRHALVGPASRALVLMEPLAACGINNLGLAVELGRLCLNGEGPEVIAGLAPYLDWVHISNCVPGLGDVQPRFQAPGSRIGPDRLAEFMNALAEINYAGPMGIAVRPNGSEVSERVVRVALTLLNEAAETRAVVYALPLGFAYRSGDFVSEKDVAEI